MRIFLFLLFLGGPMCVLAKENILDACEKLFQERLYLSTLSCLNEALIASSDEYRVERKIAGLNLWMTGQGKRKGKSYSEHHYFLGYQAWRQHDFIGARNHWVRFFSHTRLTKVHPHWQAEVKSYLDTLRKMEILPARAQEKPQRPARPRRRSRPRPVQSASPRKSLRNEHQNRINELKRNANLAIRSGQFPLAHQIYRMILNLDPTNKEAQQKLEKLENKMN